MGFLRKNFLLNESGQVAITFALIAVPLLAATSAAIDYGKITKERNAISSGLDAAVLAAANNNAISMDEKDEYAAAHFNANYSGDLLLSLTPSVTEDAVRLAARGKLELTFGNVIGIDDQWIEDSSGATLSTENTICVLALSEDADGAISYDSDLEFKANNCAVHANSTSGRAIIAEKNLHVPMAKSFCTVGGVSGLVEPFSKGECSPIADPYTDVAPAEIGTCKREFILVNDVGNMGGAIGGNTGEPSLPASSNVALDDLITELQSMHTQKNFGTDKGPVNEQRSTIETVALMTGDDMRSLLEAYEPYGEDLLCDNDPVPECYGFDNPFLGVQSNQAPQRSVVADIFDISYGEFVRPNVVPDIVAAGVVELVNGNLYSRNNIDNALVRISENLTGGNVMLTPGTYCGGLTVDGMSVQFSPGDYIFKDGPLTFLNESEARADRVTFGFTGDGATMNIETGSKLTIKAATSGPRQGLAFMQMIDPDALGNRAKVEGINRIASGGQLSMSGTAYFPEQTLIISGENSHIGAASPAVGLIADMIAFRGQRGSRVELSVDHVKAGIPPFEPRADDGVRLIE